MIFSSIPFLYYFLPVVLIGYFVTPKKFKNVTLLVASLVFYAWGEPAYVFLMAGSILMSYVLGLVMGRQREQSETNPKSRWCLRLLLGLAVVMNIGILGYFKYADFFIENVNRATGLSVPLLHIGLPVGISFYTFQLLSYLIDVYRGQVKPQKNLLHLATYITMFPQLIAGPIVRYCDVEPQLENRDIQVEKIAYGIRRFVFGLSKKVLIANLLGEFCTSFRECSETSVLFFWGYAIAVSLQIYFDFSGYSDMAIGLGSMLGFQFMENFRYPFVSKSITEFWRRWHISLGTWFRDYVYIPLGGNRCSWIRNMLNLLIVWMLTGLWHGAQWNFVVWGLYFGILLILEKRLRRDFGHLLTLLLVVISFVIFDSSNLAEEWQVLKTMAGLEGLPLWTRQTGYYFENYGMVLMMAMFGATPLPAKIVERCRRNQKAEKVLSVLEPVVMIGLLLVATAYLVDGSFNPFLYFRF